MRPRNCVSLPSMKRSSIYFASDRTFRPNSRMTNHHSLLAHTAYLQLRPPHASTLNFINVRFRLWRVINQYYTFWNALQWSVPMRYDECSDAPRSTYTWFHRCRRYNTSCRLVLLRHSYFDVTSCLAQASSVQRVDRNVLRMLDNWSNRIHQASRCNCQVRPADSSDGVCSSLDKSSKHLSADRSVPYC